MNNGKLVFCVIILCIVSPMMVGYVWPVDATSETGYEVGDPKDISNDAINAKLPVYVPYNDPFANNQNVFHDAYLSNFPVSVTDNPGPVWNTKVYAGGFGPVSIDSNGKYTIPDLGAWVHAHSGDNWVLLMFNVGSNSWISNITVDNGDNAGFILYYPQTDKMYYLENGTTNYLPIENHNLVFRADNGYEGTTQNLSYNYFPPIAGYADLSQGMKVPSNYSDWFNGYENKGFNIIFNTVDSDLAEFVYIHDPLGYDDTIVSLWVDVGTIKMTLWADGVPYYVGALGSYDLYDKVLLTVDYDSAKIVLSGLRGMNSFLDDYTSAIRESVTADWQDPVIFNSFSIEKQAGNNATWYVANTLSAVAEIDGSRNFEMDLRDYTANGSCQLNIRNVTQHGDKLGLMINTTYKIGAISKGELTITGVDETITVPVNNMLIGLIGNKVYLNGYLLFEDSNITKVNIYFYDDWKMSLVYYPVNEKTIAGFEWLPGSFGLDENGYCVVGLITSALTGLGASLYGRRNGAKMALVTFVSAMIGVVYLLVLMGGL